METMKAAQGKWHGILSTLGVHELYLRNKHQPCPLCGGNDRYRWDDKDGTGSYFCSGCGAGNGMDLLMKFKGWDFATAAKEVDKIIGNIEIKSTQKPDSDRALQRIKAVLSSLGDMSSINPVRLYLRNRGLPVSKELLYSPAMAYYSDSKQQGVHPAMVARFVLPDGSGATLHITHLTERGHKADVPSVKKFMPVAKPMAGGAIRLTKIYPHIGLAEGIETALAVMRDYQIPCWATGTAGMMEAFIPPEGINQITVFADNDANFTGQKAAYTLANRLTIKGYKAAVNVPAEINSDYADKTKNTEVTA